MKKAEEIAWRQRRVLEILAASPGGRAKYAVLAEELKVNERTARNDCFSLKKQNLAEEIKGGAAITPKGLEFLLTRAAPEEKIKEKHLRQMIILRRLYSAAGGGNGRGLTAREIVRREDDIKEDALRDVLQAMAGEGLLVQEEGGRWRLGPGFPQLVPAGRGEATLLYEYLSAVSGLAPLPPELAGLACKLLPAVLMPGREDWREEVARLVGRITVHGRPAGDADHGARVVALLEEAVAGCRAVDASYRGRDLKLYPLGAVYHWEKMRWYVISFDPATRALSEYRADRFSRLEICAGEAFERPAGFDLREHLAGRWGISSGPGQEVQVLFRDTRWHPTALDKLMADTARRQLYCPHCTLKKQPDKSVLLRDRVAGILEFASWVRSYGDAAQVLAPGQLCQKMGRTARNMLARYGAAGGAGHEE